MVWLSFVNLFIVDFLLVGWFKFLEGGWIWFKYIFVKVKCMVSCVFF